MLFAYADQKHRLEARRLHDLSMVAAFPHMTKRGARQWVDALRRAGRAVIHAADTMFTLNGRAVSMRGLRQVFRRELGGGFAEE